MRRTKKEENRYRYNNLQPQASESVPTSQAETAPETERERLVRPFLAMVRGTSAAVISRMLFDMLL